MIRSFVHVPTDAVPPERRLTEMASWAASTAIVGAFILILPALLVPGLIVRTSHPIAGTIGRSITGALLGLLGVAILAAILRVHPRTLFLRFPTRQALVWVLITGLGVGTLVGSSAVHADAVTWTAPSGMTPLLGRFAAAVAIGLWTGIVEELLIRGVVLSILGRAWRWDGAIVATAILFGLLHQGAGATTVATLLYVAVTSSAGLLLGMLVVTTGNVWNAVAVHATWNAGFSGFLVAYGTVDPPPIVSISGDLGVLLGVGGATVPESPLALATFLLLAGGYRRYLTTIHPCTQSGRQH